MPAHYEDYSEDCRNAIQSAFRVATELGHEEISALHFLLAILALQGPVSRACERLGTPATLVDRAMREQLMTTTVSPWPGVKNLFERADAERDALCHEKVEPHHLVLAMLSDHDGPVATALESACVSPPKLRAEILRSFPASKPSSEPTFDELQRRYRDHANVRVLNEQLDQIQHEKEEAVVNQDWDAAAQLRDRGVAVRSNLRAVFQQLLQQERPDAAGPA